MHSRRKGRNTMTIYVHEISNSNGHDKYFCVDREQDGKAYQDCMDYYNKIRDGKVIGAGPITDYEYTRYEEHIDFMWAMEQDDFEAFRSKDAPEGSNDYCGAVFFGEFKLEFMHIDEENTYLNCFEYGVPGYSELEDGTPYEEHWGMSDKIKIPNRRTFDAFARKIEEQIVEILNEYHEFVEPATHTTYINKWYPGSKAEYKPIKITRVG